MAEGGWSVMCTGGDGVPGSVAEALAMMRAGADYLLGPGLAGAGEAALGQVLAELTVIGSKHKRRRLTHGCRGSTPPTAMTPTATRPRRRGWPAGPAPT
jgi:hypothetical protein